RDDGALCQDGTFKLSVSDNGSPATYDNQILVQQTYKTSLLPREDVTAYRSHSSSDTKVVTSDLAGYTFTARGADGGQQGLTKGTRYLRGSDAWHVEGVSAGTVNNLDGSGSMDNHSNYNGSRSSLAFASACYNATDGSISWTAVSLATGSATYSG